eukprot:411054-Pelagomonas_calceolata.AAC.3
MGGSSEMPPVLNSAVSYGLIMWAVMSGSSEMSLCIAQSGLPFIATAKRGQACTAPPPPSSASAVKSGGQEGLNMTYRVKATKLRVQHEQFPSATYPT